jgi:hypothetical protein
VLWMSVSCECCVLSGRGLCHGCLSVVSVVCCQVEACARVDHLCRGVLPTVVCLSVIVKLR